MSAANPSAGNLRLSLGHATDRGLRREINEDSLIARDPIFAVADGMGGHEAGEVASRLCIEALADSPALAGVHISAADVHDALASADLRIRRATSGRAGTTVSGVALVEESGYPYWLFFNVGDSRAYRLGKDGFEQVTVDHSEVQELVDLGQITPEQALVHPRRHVVTRAVGAGTELGADFWLIPVDPGDRILICSDGLTSEVDDQQVHQILAAVPDPQQACDELVQAALRAGGRDNVTVIVLDAQDAAAPEAAHSTVPRVEDEEALETTLPRPDVGSAPPVPPRSGPEDRP